MQFLPTIIQYYADYVLPDITLQLRKTRICSLWNNN